ncbi:glutamate racemase [Candidatus Gribaldobacteria bacterium]|nr:glutamate racemase [Candidatus Gribaldobacteria bacterium]
MRKYSIGVFDSGFGGLAILKEVIRQLPKYNYLYLGDSNRSPYGSRTQKEIYRFTKQAVDFLFKSNCFLVILACNTSSCLALRKIQQDYLPKHYPQRRVLGVIIPTAEVAVLKTKNNKIGIIATQATTKSLAFQRELKKINPKIRAFQKACPLLVPLIERGEQNSKKCQEILRDYLKPLSSKGIDTLVLGCTHYSFLVDYLEKQFPKFLNDRQDFWEIIAEGKIVAEKLKDYLRRHQEIERNLLKENKINFLTTGEKAKFEKIGSLFFGKRIKAKKISLE